MMKSWVCLLTVLSVARSILGAETRLLDLEPTDAQQIIDKQDQSLNYAPKIETNVPAVRFLGNEPHHVLEDIYLARQYHGQDGLGGYLYGYNVPDIAKTERKKPSGDLRGAYNYIAGDGQEIKVQYWDDGTGFHQIDNVPKIQPKQVEDSPDVKAAKEKFLARWHEEAERNKHPIAYPYNSEGQYLQGSLAAQTQEQLLQHQQQIPLLTSSQHQPQGQYQQKYQHQGNPQPQYQHTFQHQGYPQPQYQHTFQHQGNPQAQFSATPNRIDYFGQSSENQNVYSRPQGQNQVKPEEADDSGKYIKGEEEEPTGPPKGFFYSFDYPVGIIVNKEGVVKREGVQEVYSENKAKFESQLKNGGAASSQSGYLYVKN